MNFNVLYLSPGQIIAHQEYGSKDYSLSCYTIRNYFHSMQNHTVMPYGTLYITLSIKAMQTALHYEGDTPSHLATRSCTYISDTNNTTKDDKYLWLNKEHKRPNMTDREIIHWKLNFKEYKLTKKVKVKVYDLIEEHHEAFSINHEIGLFHR